MEFNIADIDWLIVAAISSPVVALIVGVIAQRRASKSDSMVDARRETDAAIKVITDLNKALQLEVDRLTEKLEKRRAQDKRGGPS